MKNLRNIILYFLSVIALIIIFGTFTKTQDAPKIITPSPVPTAAPTKAVGIGTGNYAILNNYRIEHGKRPLVRSADLEKESDTFAYRQAAGLENWSHEAFRKMAKTRVTQNIGMGEILAEGSDDFSIAMTAWDNSPTHKKVMLDPFCEVGIGNYGIYWVVHFRKDYNKKEC